MKKKDEQPLVNNRYRLEKFDGKGGWTYTRIPEIPQDKNSPFGWVQVRGFIDSYEIKHYHLMPSGNNQLFLPVKAEIRKAIRKQAGDEVHIILYADTTVFETPEEFLMCLQDEPLALTFYNQIPTSEKRFYTNWIYSAKREETRVNRMAKAINRLAAGLKFNDKEQS